MSSVFRTAAIAAIAVGLGLGAYLWLKPAAGPEILVSRPEAPASEPATEPAAEPRGRRAETPEPAVVEAARRALDGGGRSTSCGPYRLLTDVEAPELEAVCTAVGVALDGVYRDRFGVVPVGRPAETIFLFAGLDRFRRFLELRGRNLHGYRGYASPAEGYLALYAGDDRTAFVQTLAHELTHLVHRRALGPNLPPWLSEGLADAVGDAAGPSGLLPLDGFDGAETQAERLRAAYARGEAGGLERLVGLERTVFDRGVRSFDYEQSALFVRFLLLDRELAPRFRAWLGEIARGGARHQESLAAALSVPWNELDQRFRSWLEAD